MFSFISGIKIDSNKRHARKSQLGGNKGRLRHLSFAAKLHLRLPPNFSPQLNLLKRSVNIIRGRTAQVPPSYSSMGDIHSPYTPPIFLYTSPCLLDGHTPLIQHLTYTSKSSSTRSTFFCGSIHSRSIDLFHQFIFTHSLNMSISSHDRLIHPFI